MSLFKRDKKQPITEGEKEQRSSDYSFNPFSAGITYGNWRQKFNEDTALKISAVYRAVNLISDNIASLQLKPYYIDNEGFKSEATDNVLYDLLAYEANQFMSRATFFKLIIQYMLLRGNAYIIINRDNRLNVKSLELVDSNLVSIQRINDEIRYVITGKSRFYDASEIIHILNYPILNQLTNIPEGISTLSYAAQTLEIANASDKHAGYWFKNGANSNVILSTSAQLNSTQTEGIKTQLRAFSDPATGNPNGIALLPSLPELKSIPLGISPKDSQLLESRAFNVLDIARFFNVNPILLFDNQNVKLGNAENSQIDFLNTTLLSIIEKIENEFTRKLIIPSQRRNLELRFDLTNLLRADSGSRADYYTKMYQLGVYSTNQIAKELNLSKVDGDGANKHFIQVNLQPLDNLFADQKNPQIDKKLLKNE